MPTPREVCLQYADIKSFKDKDLAMQLINDALQLGVQELNEVCVRHRRAGTALIIEHVREDKSVVILECVMGKAFEDSIGSLYHPHKIFESMSGVLEARLALIDALERALDHGVGELTRFDSQRRRKVTMSECPIEELLQDLKDVLGINHC
jgi:hypothetical protein